MIKKALLQSIGIIAFTLLTSNVFAQITETGTNVGISNTAPLHKLDVNGDLNLTTGRSIRFGSSVVLSERQGTDNFSIASGAGQNLNPLSRYNVLIGSSAGRLISSGRQNSFIGFRSGYSATVGYNNSFIGAYSGYNTTTGVANTFLGSVAGFENVSGNFNLYLGVNAGRNAVTGSNNIAIGNNAGQANLASDNMFIGRNAFTNNTTGTLNAGLGYGSGLNNTTGNRNMFIGYEAGSSNISGSENTYIGYLADGTAALTNATAIGAGAQATADNMVQLGNSAVANVKTTGQLTTGAVTYPNVDGAAGDILTTNGTGGASWTAPSVGGILSCNAPITAPGSYPVPVNSLILVEETLGPITLNFSAGVDGDQIMVKSITPGTSIAGHIQIQAISAVIEDPNNPGVSLSLWTSTAAFVGGIANEGYKWQFCSGNIGENGGRWIAVSDYEPGNAEASSDTDWIESGNYVYNVTDSVGIGTTTPAAKLNLVGGDALIHGITVGRGGGNIATNTANGSDALWSNTTGYRNTATGRRALQSNTTGYGNTANGWQALQNNNTGSRNTANGSYALWSNQTGNYNTANGDAALQFNTSGFSNTANGFNALSSNNTGRYNTANGADALWANTTGYYNTANGYLALVNNRTGYYNTASGAFALLSNTTGSYNSAYGNNTLRLNIDGEFNTAIGRDALFNNTTGDYNTANGPSANSVGTSYNNTTGLGYNADNTASNSVMLGNASVTSIEGQVGWTTLSDKRFKTDIRKDEIKGLEFITALEPVTYNYDIDAQAAWKEENYGEKDTAQWEGKYDIEKIRFSGFLAQDVEALAKEVGYDFSGVDAPKNDKDIYGLRYAEFVVPLVKAVQEQQEQIEGQQEMIDEQQIENEELRTRLDKMEELLSRFDSDLEQCCLDYNQGNAGHSNGGSTGLDEDAAQLEQNQPNPFSENTSINYYLPSNTENATMAITDMNGTVIKNFILAGKGYGQVLIGGGSLTSGTYIYTLTVNGEQVDSKRMMLL